MLADGQIHLYFILRAWIEAISDFEVIDGGKNLTVLRQKLADTAPDILLLDWNLTGLETNDGRRELLQSLYTCYPSLRIVIMSSTPTMPPLLANLQVDGYISKTEPPELLLELLHTL